MPDITLDVRPATEADLGPVTALLVAQLREHRVETPEASIAAAIARVLRHPERGRILVAVDAGRVVGVAALSFVWPIEHGDRSSWLEELYVEPAARERGIGTRLLRASLATAAASGAVAVDLEVDADHARVARLYAREGFRPLPRARWVRALPAGETRPPVSIPEVTGGCFCGAIRYRASAPPRDVAHCHCGICRRTTGAAFVTWATFPAASFAFTAGKPVELHATPHAVRELCPACGTALTFREPSRPGTIDVTVGSMDQADVVAPEKHIWTTSRLAWVQLTDDLPRHAEEDPAERTSQGS